MFNSTEITIINKLCDKYKFEYIVYDDMTYIRSKYDSWRIIKNDCTYKLYHKNRSKHTCNLNQSCEDMGNYHFQSECQDMTKLNNIINYLHRHDEGLIKRYVTKKTSVDIMFEKIINPKRYKIT